MTPRRRGDDEGDAPRADAPRADARRNRERVLDAVFALPGDLRDLSLDEIARQAGVGRSTLFRHFPTRDDLLLAAMRRAVEEGRAMAEEAVAAGGGAAAVLERLGRGVVRLASRFRVLRSHRELAARLVGPEVGEDPLTAWVHAAHARGELRQDLTPRWIVDMLVALAMTTADQLAEPGADEQVVGAMLSATLVGAFVAPHPPG